MTTYERALLACFVGSPLFLMGCGGGSSQDDMRRHAIRRTPNEVESAVAKPKADVDAHSDVQPPVAVSLQADAAATVPVGEPFASEPGSQQLTSVGEAATNSDAVTTQIDTASAPVPPAEPLSPAARRERTANNLTQIGAAWRAYLQDKRCFPGPITSVTKQPLLSWRVELLPHLGLKSLYDAFHTDEAWDSPHNITLLAKIPSVFQSPERFDTSSNYLAITLGGTTVYQVQHKLSESNVEDGIENTLAVIEVDDEQAVPWTQPNEFQLVMATPLESLGRLRGNGLFVLWSNGKASWIDKAVDPKLFAKACTIDSGDGFRGSQIEGDLAVGIAVPVVPSSQTAVVETAASVAEPNVADAVPTRVEVRRWTLDDAHASIEAGNVNRPQPVLVRAPIPPASELKIARDVLRELYQGNYAATKADSRRLHLAREMLERVPDLGGDIAGQYALLEIVRQIAIQAGGVDVALNATYQMTARFELNDNVLLDAFEKLARTSKVGRSLDQLLDEAERAFDDLVLAEDFDGAERISQIAMSAANKVEDRDAVEKFSLRRQWAGAARDLQEAAKEGLVTLETHPQDPRANGDVGKFLCLIKGDWQNGLVILANGNDRSLKRLAEMELGDLSDSMQQLELADLWQREAESTKPAFQATLHSRANHWYEQALLGLPAGLVRIRVERRLGQD